MRPLVAGFYSRMTDRFVPVFRRFESSWTEYGAIEDYPTTLHQRALGVLIEHRRCSCAAPRETPLTMAQSQFFLSMVGKSISDIPRTIGDTR